ncbi:MAG: HNH endonuclease [Gammaproteobacteria bacterium]|nr:HNH endonuclease [Gammaproteobacteria bacterium]
MDDKTLQRFWSKVDKDGPVPKHRPGPCWVWAAFCNEDGYGKFSLDGWPQYAHRVAWQIQRGGIPAGLCVLHHCDNRPCVRGSHLFLGTNPDNTADMVMKQRAARQRGETNGRSKLTEADVNTIRTRYASGGISQRKLAKDFGVSQALISVIVNRKNWAHVGAQSGTTRC